MNILVVDDEAEFVSVVGESLSRNGHRVEGVTDGRRALDLMNDNEYQAVILDLVMPTANGLRLVAKIREKFPAVFVIVMSAIMDVRVAVQAAQAGADACFDKVLGLKTLSDYLAAQSRRMTA